MKSGSVLAAAVGRAGRHPPRRLRLGHSSHWFAPAPPEKPRVTGRIEQPAPAVAPAPVYTAPPVRTTRVISSLEPARPPHICTSSAVPTVSGVVSPFQ